MIIDFEEVGHRYKKIIRPIYEKALQVTGNNLPKIRITVSFAKRDRIRELNRRFRKVDKETDVLSFPMLDIVYPQTLRDYKSEYSPDGTLYIGDVVICKKIAKKQAKEYGHSKKREVAFLALHGLLHVLGYDHIEPADEEIMMKTSEKILKECGFERD